MKAIYKKELLSYFTSMIGYVFIAFFLMIFGVYFTIYHFGYQYANFEYVLQSVSFLFVLLVPILTMRTIAEERKQKTDQLLLTSPVSIEKIVIGKYAAVLTVFLIAMAVIAVYPILLLQFGKIDLKLAYVSILGFLLMGVADIAIGVFISALTENQIVAAVLGFVAMLFIALLPGMASFFPTSYKAAFFFFAVIIFLFSILCARITGHQGFATSLGLVLFLAFCAAYFYHPSSFDGSIAKTLQWLSITDRFQKFTNGILDLSAVIYNISVAVVFLCFTVQTVKKRRWSEV